MSERSVTVRAAGATLRDRLGSGQVLPRLAAAQSRAPLFMRGAIETQSAKGETPSRGGENHLPPGTTTLSQLQT